MCFDFSVDDKYGEELSQIIREPSDNYRLQNKYKFGKIK